MRKGISLSYLRSQHKAKQNSRIIVRRGSEKLCKFSLRDSTKRP